MKWLPIEKAKPKFDQLYLLSLNGTFQLGHLDAIKKGGAVFTFVDEAGEEVKTNATHIAIVTDPNTDKE